MNLEKVILALTAIGAGLPSALTFDFYIKEKPEYLPRALLSVGCVGLALYGVLENNDLAMVLGFGGIGLMYIHSIAKAVYKL